MPKRQVFYSFHYDLDVMRVQQIRNIGAIEDNKPVSTSDWEEIRRYGDASIERWIDENMKYRSCVVVLIGAKTSTRSWVDYEIKKAWMDKKGLLGIHIHNLRCPRTGLCQKGANPFDNFIIPQAGNAIGKSMSQYVPCYDPNPYDSYGDISNNLDRWVEVAISNAASRP